MKRNILSYYHTERASTPKPIRPILFIIPKSKNQLLDEYVMSHDTITRDILDSFGINQSTPVLKGAERRCKCEIVPISNSKWQITK